MTYEQAQAANPGHSVWVSASAGTGKTKVLTDRVLRLLLQGVSPEKILCLTFTKAAAAEMSLRIRKELGSWVMMKESALVEKLRQLTDISPGIELLQRARTLFLTVIDHPEGLPIQTIHAFCQKLMRRFPVEAGIPPYFQVIDERDMQKLLKEARLQLLSDSIENNDSLLLAALRDMTAYVHEQGIDDALQTVIENRDKLQRIFTEHGSLENAISDVYHTLGTSPLTDTEYYTPLCELHASAYEALHNAALALEAENQVSATLLTWLRASVSERVATFAAYQDIFLTQQGTARAKLLPKALATQFPEALSALEAEQQRVLHVHQGYLSLRTARLTGHLLYVGHRLLMYYAKQKQMHGCLDYPDLILHSHHLLADSSYSPWVLFKLDGGVDHILVDEAQDTSPEQWHIIHQLCAEFFAGESSHSDKTPRTLFVVGDEKQSIFSFQGAQPECFHAMRALYCETEHATSIMRAISLETSFRSTENILRAVDAVCALQNIRPALTSLPLDIAHKAHRQEHPGSVLLLPLIVGNTTDTAKEEESWALPSSYHEQQPASHKMAEWIALTIKEWLDTKTVLIAKNRPIRASDIMILVRKRDSFVHALIRALKRADIPVAGIDRMVLTDQLAIQDLCALGHFLLCQEDDLTLACILKSPLIGLTEEDLFTLAHGRHGSLWDALVAERDNAPFEAAYLYLSSYLQKVDYVSPFTLYSDILEVQKGRERLAKRLGEEVYDPLDEWLTLAYRYEQTHTPSLQGFLEWIASGSTEIKRDMEQGQDQVRIMTVHSAKGLQAPIVFLPDTTQIPTHTSSLLWENGVRVFWGGSVDYLPPHCRHLRDIQKQEALAEYWRLLYVAMTRAEDVLIVGGFENNRKASEHSWYHAISEALPQIADSHPLAIPQSASHLASSFVEHTHYCVGPSAFSLEKQDATLSSLLASPLAVPVYLSQAAPLESTPSLPIAPSHFPEEAPPAARSPLAVTTPSSHGILVHSLLEHLPQVPEAQRMHLGMRILARQGGSLSQEKRQALLDHVLTILSAPEFSWIFYGKTYTEVPVTGTVSLADGKKAVIAGRIDRLVFHGKDIAIIDYKTHTVPEMEPEKIATAYIKQLAAYHALISPLYPEHTVRCYLLWTSTLQLLEIPAHLLKGYVVASNLLDMNSV